MGKEVFTIAMRQINKANGNSSIYISGMHEWIAGVSKLQMLKGNPRVAKALISGHTGPKQWSVVFDINDLISFNAFMKVEEENEQEENPY